MNKQVTKAMLIKENKKQSNRITELEASDEYMKNKLKTQEAALRTAVGEIQQLRVSRDCARDLKDSREKALLNAIIKLA